MKKALLILSVFFFTSISAQVISFDPKTGDVEMDGFLKEINTEAKKDVQAFTNQVTTKFNILKTDVDKLLKDLEPGDVYMAAQVATIINKPVTEVSASYQKNKGKGWGVIAKEMGIKPGSPEFHKLKQAMKKNGKGDEKDKDNNGGGHGKGNGHGHGKK